MTVDETMIRLRRQLEEAHGVDGAAILMDRPHGGWGALVTNDTLDLKLAALEERTRAQFAAVRGEIVEVRGEMRGEIAGLRAELHSEMRDQTWRLIGAVIVSMAILGSILRLA
jgi:hypothetical protein